MTAVALKGLLARKTRAVLTALAIVLGVAMVSGTYILTDTIQSAFSTVFTQANKNSDAVVSGKSAIGGNNDNGPNSSTPSVPESLLTQIRALPAVAQASGGISDSAQLIGHNGKVLLASRTAVQPPVADEGQLAKRTQRGRDRRLDRRQGPLQRW